jgi:glyoxylase-like metal-dependent hydrolase (beta-lactamase superfamily II)
MAVHHMRVLEPAEGIFAFYDGRVESHRFSDEPNWVDGGALSLGIASYALVAGHEAVVYDTHVSVQHARHIRSFLEAQGVRRFTVVLSHWHLDHVAGTEAFDDCQIVASERTAAVLATHRAAIEAGALEGPPGIDPLVLPTAVFSDRTQITYGDASLELIHTHIHSDDATVIWLPERRLLLCGDTLEDTVTYVDEPEHFDVHLANLKRLRRLGADRILPNHGDPDVIAGGGYRPDLIDATEAYIRALQRCRTDPSLIQASLREFIAPSLAAGSLHYYAGYEPVHRQNVDLVTDRTP